MPKEKRILKNLLGLKDIFKYLRPYRKEIFILSFLAVFSALADTSIPYLSGKIIDGIINAGLKITILSYSVPAVAIFIIVWFLVKVVGDIFGWQMDLKRERLTITIEGDFIVKGFSHLLELPLSFHKKHKIGEIANRIGRAAGWLEQITGSVVIDLAPQVISVILAIFVVFSVKAKLALILTAAVLIYLIVLFGITPGIAKLQKKGQEAYSRAFGDAYDSVINASSVKQATAEKYEKRKLHRNFLLRAARFFMEYMKNWHKINLSQRILISLTQLSIFFFSIFMIWRGEMTIGQLVMFNAYAAMFFGPFVTLARNWQHLNNGLIAIRRAEKVLGEPKETYEPRGIQTPKSIKGEVEFHNVGFEYGKKQPKILDDVSFKVLPGEIVALVGESGVGKTTLVDLISFYFKPTKGKIFIDDLDLKKINLKFLRKNIAAVPQEVILFNDTIKNNIRYGSFEAADDEIIAAAKKAHCHEFIEKFPQKYNQVVGERGIKLSVGQKQRIAIARAILRDPKILILDEPTSALDAKSEKYVMSALEELMKNRTVFVIAHRLSTVRKAHRIFVIEKGKIVEEGKHEDLIKITNGAYRRFYELQRL